MANAVQAFKADLTALIKERHYQWVVAICALVFGLIALYDGQKFFQLLVLVSIAAVFFCFVLSQLRSTWTGAVASVAKYVVSLEVGAFIGLAAYKGWEGTQLLLGLAVGIYLFDTLQGIALLIPYVQIAAHHSVWIVSVGTLMVAVGSWMVHQKYGAGRVLGIFAPLFGSSLVVATCGYFSMLCVSVPAVGKALHVAVSRADVPSVFEFWYMIAYPMHSQAVGFFEVAGKDIVLDNTKFEIDRILGIFFWVVIFTLGMSFQLKADSKERAKTSDALKARLLVKDVRTQPDKIQPFV